MKLKKLYLENFKNIAKLSLDFSSYINLIEGDNGSGKSSVLDAITYILTDTLNDKISEYVRWGSDKFIIILEFDHNSDSYIMKVEGSASSKKELIINETDVYKNSEATKKLSEIIDPIITKYSSISEQGKSTALLFDTPANRLKRLKEILGIDRLQIIVDEMKEESKEKSNQVDTLKKEVTLLEQREFHLQEVPIISDSIDDIKKQHSILEKEKLIYETEIKQFHDYERDKKIYDESLIKIKECNDQALLYIKQKDIEQSKLKEIKVIDITKLNEEIVEFEKAKVLINTKISAYLQAKNRITVLEDNLSNLNKTNKDLVVRRIPSLDFTSKDIDDLDKKILSISVSLSDYKRQLDLAEKGKCPTCEKDYIVDKDSIKAQILEYEKSLLNLNEDKKSKLKQLDDYNNLIIENDKNKILKSSIESDIERILLELDELRKVEEVSNDIDYAVTIKNLKDQINEYTKDVAFNVSIEKLINNIQNDIDIKIKLQKEYSLVVEPKEVKEPIKYNVELYNNLMKEILVYDQKVLERDRIIEHNNIVLADKKNNDIVIKDKKLIIEKLSHEVGVLDESRKLIDKDFSSYLIDKGTQFIKDKMNQFFQTAYGRYEITFEQDKSSVNFFYGDGKTVGSVSLASGYEKQLLSVAFRYAISSLQNLNFLVMDEVDSDSGIFNSIKLFETLLGSTKDTQFFIVSHKEESKEYLLNQRGAKGFTLKGGNIS